MSPLLPPNSMPPANLLEDSFNLFTRDIVALPLPSGTGCVRTTTLVIKSKTYKGKRVAKRCYQYLLALAWGCDVVDEKGGDIGER